MPKVLINGVLTSVNADGTPRKKKGKRTVAERRAALAKAQENLSFDAAKVVLSSSPRLLTILEGRKKTRKFLREAKVLADPKERAEMRARLEARILSLDARGSAAQAYLASDAGKAAESVDGLFVALGEAAETFDPETDDAEALVAEYMNADAVAALTNPADPFDAWRMKKKPDGAGSVSVSLPDNPPDEDDEDEDDETDGANAGD